MSSPLDRSAPTPEIAVLAKCIGALEGLAAASIKQEAMFIGNDIPVNKAADALHSLLAEREALVNVAKAAEEMFRRNDDETQSDAEVQEAHDLLREAIAVLNQEQPT